MDLRFALIPIIVLPLGLAALVLAAQAWQEQRQSRAAKGWQTTTGRVVRSGLRETAVRVRSSISISHYRMAKRYAPQIIYEYQVNGSRYQSERLHMGLSLITSEIREVEREVERYPIGREVTVYYNPFAPAEATLNPHLGWGTRNLWIIVLIMLIIIVVVIAIFLNSPPIIL